MRNMPMKPSHKKLGRKARGWHLGLGRLALVFVAVLLVASIFAILWFTSAYYIHKSINRVALQAAQVVANPNVYATTDELLYGTNLDDLSSNSVLANLVAPALKSNHLNPKQVTKYSEQVTWLDPQNPNPQCGVIVYFEYPFALHIPFTHLDLTLIRLKAAAQMPKETKGAAGTCS